MNGGIISDLHKALFQQIKVFVLDVDGVFTDGTVTLNNESLYARSYHTRDGFAVRHALEAGYKFWIITGGQGNSITARFEMLGVDEVWCVPHKKKEAILQQLIDKYQVKSEQLCYMGDDVPDIAAMKLCALRSCPKDASRDILDIANYVASVDGGRGCVREVIEQVMRHNNNW